MKHFNSISLLFLFVFSLGITAKSQTWQDVGGGANSSSHGLCVWNGELVNVGSFNNPCDKVAGWDGTSWSCYAGGVGLVGRAAIEYNGNLVVVGDFWNVQQPCTDCNGVAMWDGTQWLPLGTGFNNDVLCLTIWNGELIAGGDFTEADGNPCSRVARWTGTQWLPIGGITTPIFDNDIRCLAVYDGDLWAGGDFNNVNGCTACDGLVRWDGTAWVGGNSGVDVVGGVDSTVRCFYVDPINELLYLGGHFTELNSDPNMSGIAVYDGSDWYPLGTGVNSYVRAIGEYNGNIIVGGDFNTAGSLTANKVAKWNPTTSTWSAMGTGMNDYIKSIAVYNGDLYVGGPFTTADGQTRNCIAKWYEAPSSPPVAAINASVIAVCAGSCINVTDNSSNSPLTWTWSFPGATPTSSSVQNPGQVCYAASGTYTITLTACNGSGCNTTTQNITVSNSPSVTVNNLTICAGSSGTLTANGAGTYAWSPSTGLSATTGTSVIANPASTTTYTVTGTTSGCSASANAVVTVNPVPTAASSNNGPYCAGSTIQLSSSGGTSYGWSGPLGFTSTLQNPTVNNATTAMSGVYTVTVTSSGCSATSTTTVTVNASPVASASNDGPYCEGDDIQLSSSGGTTYSWTGPNSFSSSLQNPLITNSTLAMNGVYTVTVTSAGCSSVATTTVSVGTAVTASASNTGAYCSGENIVLSSSGGTSYSWTGPNGFTSALQNPTINNSTVAMAGTYTVTVSNGGCNDVASTTVVVNQSPLANATNDGPYCAGENIQLTSAGGTGYSWIGPNSFTSSLQNPQIAGSTNLMSGNYIVTVSDGTCSSSTTTTVTVNDLPTNTISISGFQLTSDQNTGTWQWVDCNAGMSAITGATSQQFNPTVDGNYAVIVQENSCSDTSACVTVFGMGIGTNANEFLFAVYPNPVADLLTVEIKSKTGDVNFQINDAAGKIVLQGKITEGTNSISMKDLAAGMYILTLNNGGAVMYQKVVKD